MTIGLIGIGVPDNRTTGVQIAAAEGYAVFQGETAFHTLPLHIEILYNEYNFTAAFAVASILVILAVLILVLRNLAEGRAKGGSSHAESI